MNFLNFRYTFVLLTEVHKNVPASLSPVIFLREVFCLPDKRREEVNDHEGESGFWLPGLEASTQARQWCDMQQINLSKPHTAHQEKGDELVEPMFGLFWWLNESQKKHLAHKC